MNKNTFTTVKLSKGEMNVYDFGKIRLHAYKTNDFMSDEVFIIEKDGRAVIIEAPCFFDNINELTEYCRGNGFTVCALLLAYHMAGASFMPGIPVYSTANADAYGHIGGGFVLIRNFAATFGDIFDKSVFTVTNKIGEGKIAIAGIDFIITKTQDAFDIEIPELNAVYTHMLGHDSHSIVAGTAHADAVIAQLKEYIGKGYGFVLSSHYTPEDLKDAAVKIAYLQDLKALAEKSCTAQEFKEACKKRFPDYSGEDYLEMTASFFFK